MTAPDPGLTELIAAHQLVSTDTIFHRNGMVQRPECKCGELMHWAGAYPAHLALVVEQHTNGRTAELATKVKELEADITHRKVRNTISRMGRDDDPETIAAWRETVMGWMYRAETAELEAEDLKSTIARVEAAMEKAPVYQLACEHRFDEPYETVEVIELRRVRAALGGEQQ